MVKRQAQKREMGMEKGRCKKGQTKMERQERDVRCVYISFKNSEVPGEAGVSKQSRVEKEADLVNTKRRGNAMGGERGGN